MAVETITDNDFQNFISSHDKVVVKYFAGWCGSCRLIAPKFKRYSNDEKYQGVNFIEVNAEHNPEARKLAGVDNLPFFASFISGELKDGKATNKEDQIIELIENTLS